MYWVDHSGEEIYLGDIEYGKFLTSKQNLLIDYFIFHLEGEQRTQWQGTYLGHIFRLRYK